jgi:hypothetical protein
MEAVMRSSLTQLVFVAMTVVALSTSADAQSPVERAYPGSQDVLVNRHDTSHSETDFRLGDHMMLKGYFLHSEGSRRLSR